jgi:hypothetical protein
VVAAMSDKVLVRELEQAIDQEAAARLLLD